MSNCTQENESTSTNSCQSDGGGCGTNSQVSCCGYVDPAERCIFADDVEVKQRIYNERKLVKENEKIYKDFRKDFNPVIWGIGGLLLGAAVGTTVEQLLMIGSDVTYTAIFGLFLGVSICVNKNRANQRQPSDNL